MKNEEGYLTSQHAAQGIAFGRCDSSYNGCGWIAAYNFLRAAQHGVPAETVRKELEKNLLFGGRLGTNLFFLKAYLRKKGVPTRFCVQGTKKEKTEQRAVPFGIVFYYNGAGFHFVAFQKREQQWRFYNVAQGSEEWTGTPAALLKKYARFPLAVVLYPVSKRKKNVRKK